ncbi:hypothetical protein [Hyphococcus sp.]|jgi:hypothetical protein|uniref:hypothetical protein n=1 Tax=Hyphococcus sp. TaxID=2038636 RepID=UPI003D0CEEB1
MGSNELISGAIVGSWMRKYYFSYVSAVTLALSVWGFSDNLFWNIGQPSNSDPKFVIHGLFCLTWMIVFFLQANLVRTGNLRLHRKLGVAGFIAAIGVTVTTLYVFAAVWKGWDAMSPLVKANRLLLPSYSALVLLAILNRGRSDWHKRLILIATLYMLEPILSRAFDPLEPLMAGLTDSQIDFYWWIFFVLVWNGLFASLFAYDFLTQKRIHQVTIAGYAWFCAIWIFVHTVSMA